MKPGGGDAETIRICCSTAAVTQVSGTALLLIDVMNDLAFEGPRLWLPRRRRRQESKT